MRRRDAGSAGLLAPALAGVALSQSLSNAIYSKDVRQSQGKNPLAQSSYKQDAKIIKTSIVIKVPFLTTAPVLAAWQMGREERRGHLPGPGPNAHITPRGSVRAHFTDKDLRLRSLTCLIQVGGAAWDLRGLTQIQPNG